MACVAETVGYHDAWVAAFEAAGSIVAALSSGVAAPLAPETAAAGAAALARVVDAGVQLSICLEAASRLDEAAVLRQQMEQLDHEIGQLRQAAGAH